MGVENSTKDLFTLLDKADKEDLYILAEYNFGKDCPRKSVADIVKELQYNGSNDFAFWARGQKGVEYLEIVRDVAKKLSVKWDDKDNTEDIEQKCILKMIEKSWNDLSSKDQEELRKLFQDEGYKGMDFSAAFSGAAFISQLLMTQLATIVAGAISRLILERGLVIAGGAAIGRAVGIALGPIGWIVTGIWTAIDLAGPAYRKTIPSVLHIAFLRQKQKLQDLG